MRTIIKPVSATQAEIWRGAKLAATIYATPGGITIQADRLEPSDVDMDGHTVHVELQRGE